MSERDNADKLLEALTAATVGDVERSADLMAEVITDRHSAFGAACGFAKVLEALISQTDPSADGPLTVELVEGDDDTGQTIAAFIAAAANGDHDGAIRMFLALDAEDRKSVV